MKGWVYVFSNKSMPGLVKVGYTRKDPSLRAVELSGTGTPTPCEVVYEVITDGPYDIEQMAHSRLSARGVHINKEWFRCSVLDAIAAIREAIRSKNATVWHESLTASAFQTATSSASSTNHQSPLSSTKRAYGRQMQYMCPYCSHATTQADSHVGRCGYCGRTAFVS